VQTVAWRCELHTWRSGIASIANFVLKRLAGVRFWAQACTSSGDCDVLPLAKAMMQSVYVGSWLAGTWLSLGRAPRAGVHT
jgi:hypothetical protein